MCHYRFYIYLGCGHSTFSSTPVRYCPKASNPTPAKPQRKPSTRAPPRDRNAAGPSDPAPSSRPWSSRAPPKRQDSKASKKPPPPQASNKPAKLVPCREGLIHPLHTVKIDSVCPGCAAERDERLERLAMFSTEIKFDPARWQSTFRAGGTKRVLVEDEGGVEEGVGEGGEGKTVVVDGEGKEHKVGSTAAGGGWTGARWIKDWRWQG